MNYTAAFRLGLLILSCSVFARPAQAKPFVVTVLGARGGVEDGNLSAYLVREKGSASGIMLDAGTVINGIEQADRQNAFRDMNMPSGSGMERAGFVLRDGIKGYLISHAHLDHVAGLVIASPEDRGKSIYALPSVLSVFQSDLFNNRVWPNLGDRGTHPFFGFYHYETLSSGVPSALVGTGLDVTAYPLSHAGIESTAFLLKSGPDYLLYLGDTGPDGVEHSGRLDALWKAVAPLIQRQVLRGVIIECSYDDQRPDRLLFGHLSPRWLMHELEALQRQAGVSMKGFPVLVSHIKPTFEVGLTAQQRIMMSLQKQNKRGFRFIIAESGMTIEF